MKDKKEKKERQLEKKEVSSEESDEGPGDKGSKEDTLDYDDQHVKEVIKSVEGVVSQSGTGDVNKIFDEVRDQQLAKAFDHKLRLYIVLQGVCGSSMDAKALSESKKVVSKFITEGKMPGPDEDWADEAAILSYYNDRGGAGEPGFDEVKQAAAPFLKWLETPASDEDEEEESEDEDEEDSD